jgi:sugar O-acyltransferase (sialic acid O-acetyltransferase NeuD family)
MKAFLGFGDLGKQILGFLQEKEAILEAHYFDDNFISTSNFYFPFNAYIDNLLNYEWIISLGYNNLILKQEIIKKILNFNGKLTTIIHDTSYISPRAKILQGVIIYPMCNIDKGVLIEEGVILNNSVIVSHDSRIGRASYVGPGVVISGNCIIGKSVFIGSGSVISNGIEIGDNSIIGIGSVVIKNIKSNSNGIGNPFKILKTPLTLK